MDYQTMRVELIERQIAVVVIDSKPVNSITSQMIDDIETVFEGLNNNKSIRAVVITSALEKVFAAGADINQFTTWKKQAGINVTKRGNEVYKKISEFRAPVICAINGIAFGGGMELALACDIRVIDERAKVGLPEVNLGIVPGYGGTQRLPRMVGTGMAKKMILTGEPITAEEAYQIGLVEVIAAHNETRRIAVELAQKICARAPLAVEAGKRCVNYTIDHTLDDGIAFEVENIGILADTDDKTEGAGAFLEKRTPVFNRK